MSLAELNTTGYQFLRDYISEQTGIELGPDRQYLVQSRLEPLMSQNGFRSLADLCSAIIQENVQSRRQPGQSPPLKRKLIHALTTHETSFFRDPDCFHLLKSSILPALIASNGPGRLRIWSAAASSGQEPYSLAILCAEMGISPPPSILASDVSSIVLEIATAGTYTDYELLRGFEDATLREKYLIPIIGGAQIAAPIRQTVEFRWADLRDDSVDLGPFDMVLCRNVLIYFDELTRSAVLSHLVKQLRPGGVLVLGAAEAIWTQIPGLRRVESDYFTYYEKVN